MKHKTTFKILLIFLFSIILQNIVLACSCGHEPVFCIAVKDYQNVIRARVIDKPDVHLMRVEILDNLNHTITEDTITIVGHDGSNCGEVLWQFDISSIYILALGGPGASTHPDDYFLSICGQYFLEYEEGIVKGQITEDLTIQSYQDFKENILECLDFDLELFPNPVSKTIKVKYNTLLESSIEIFKSNGQFIHQTPKEENYSITINVEDFAGGVYFIRIHTNKGIRTRRFVKI